MKLEKIICPECNGSGYVEYHNDGEIYVCHNCKGEKYINDVSFEEKKEMEKIMSRYPNNVGYVIMTLESIKNIFFLNKESAYRSFLKRKREGKKCMLCKILDGKWEALERT